ncbi:MAG: outer membrane beta-barrel protein [Mangrovibacterium sp.]
MVKKSLLLMLLAIASVSVTNAQELRIGAGLNYSTGIEQMGIGIDGIYAFNKKWELAAGYDHMFENYNYTWNILDLDGRYNFANSGKSTFYAVGGLNITWHKWDDAIIKSSITDFGLNLGAGVNIPLGSKFVLNPEAKFTIQDESYFRIGCGIQYVF